MTADKRLTVNLSPEQMEALKTAANACGIKSLSDFAKRLIRFEMERIEFPFPDDDNAWGRTDAPRTKDGKFASDQNK